MFGLNILSYIYGKGKYKGTQNGVPRHFMIVQAAATLVARV
jgi:hypothetical protein